MILSKKEINLRFLSILKNLKNLMFKINQTINPNLNLKIYKLIKMRNKLNQNNYK